MRESTNSHHPLGPIKLSSQSEQGAVDKYDLTVFIDSSRAPPGLWKAVYFVQGPSNLPVDSLDWVDQPHPRFPIQGHILSIGGDALSG